MDAVDARKVRWPVEPAGRRAWIPEAALSGLSVRIDRLARRAERLGRRPPAIAPTGARRRESGVDEVEVELEGEVPALAGCQLVAELRHGEGETDVVPLVREPGTDLGAWRSAKPRCEHCGVHRRRRVTYLLRHRSGDLVQVGSGCVRAFTGAEDPLGAVALARALQDAARVRASEAGRGGRAEPTVLEYLAAVAAVAAKEGFAAVAEVTHKSLATAERAAELIESLRARQGPPLSDRARREAAGVERWVLDELSARERRTRFEERLLAVFGRSERVGPRARATVAAGWLAHSRVLARRERAYVASVGAPVEVEVEVEVRGVRTARRSSRFGAVLWHDLRDRAGHRLAWFAVGTELEEGTSYRLRGAVRRHETFQGKAVTVLERCRVEPLGR
jgi:hypothetical protein